MLQFGLRLGRAPAPAHHHHAAADRADQAADRRSAHRGDARADAGQRRASSPAFLDEVVGALRRHAARPAGDRRRDHRGPRRRAVDARDDRGCARRCGAAAGAHRGRDRSAGLGARRAPTPAASSRPAAPRTAASMCWRMRRAQGLTPAGWAAKAVALYRRLKADALVAEVNQGGDMVRAVLRAGRRDGAAARPCTRTRGKWLRAEPVAAIYAQGRVKHVEPPLAALEDEMCDFGLDGLSSRPLARPARRAGVGGDRADRARRQRAAHQRAVSGTLTRRRLFSSSS